MGSESSILQSFDMEDPEDDPNTDIATDAAERSQGKVPDDAWITKKLEIGRCELTNLPFSKDVSSPFGASVDRVKAGGDYTKDNCRVVIRAINTALSNWGEEVLKVVSQAYLARAA
jgi:hypothetical protein